MTFKKTVALGCSAALVLGLVACSSDSSGGGDNYVIANGFEPSNPLLPADTSSGGGGRIVDLINSGLVYYDNEGVLHNELAESIELEGDKTYRITLKDDIKFEDGSDITSANFVDAWNYAVAHDQFSAYFFAPILGYAESVESMEGLKIVDDKTFTIELTQPEADFPLRLGYSAFFPLHESAFDDIAAFGESPIASGPYKLAEWNHQESAVVIPNEHYAGDRKANNDGVKFVFYPSRDAAYADLLAGNLDVLDAIPDSALATFETELGDRFVNQPAAAFQSFTIPQRLEHFGMDEEGALRRQAISMAINREEITKTIFDNTRIPATDFTSPVIDGHVDNLAGKEVVEFNPTKAKELWEQADAITPYTGEFVISYNADGGHQAWVDAVANQLKNNLGIQATGNPYPDFKSLRGDITKRTISGAFRTSWQAVYPGLSSFLGPLYATGGGSNDGDYSSAEFDALLEQGAAAKSVAESITYYNQAQEILLQDLPAIPLWYANATGGFSQNVDNVVFSWRAVPAYYQITKN
ncbi:peptide ABC transporter substrate-binding protein [Corynebacterium kutscheri]|uniref:Peptide ABC transporter peptide-binding protein n=1 Tax=Corynebacterium kutscheri TaxID=35755 RepID=A0AB38VUI0_9CORY|nr:ABC transporter substrate-binding protein [Corynebacterium kutscheri]VEH09012.1 peptide ABC transporter peptide-binding protein [Corynebacterium kutscheri]